MADAVQACQRNIYARTGGTRMVAEYRSGNGTPYKDYLRQISWPIPTDVPSIGQASAAVHLPELKDWQNFTDGSHYMHPTKYGKLRHSDHLSFSKSMGNLGVGQLADPKKSVVDRLYLGSKSQASIGLRTPKGRLEMAGDIAFKNGDACDAVPLYTKALAAKPDLFGYEKRCCALAEMGRYRDALKDAETILKHSEGNARGAALMRVKALKDFMRRTDNFEAGYHEATSTLICLLRPREYRQLVPSIPCSFGRPQTHHSIGKGLSGAASMVSLMNWDTDGDGDIDMDELAKGVEALGYTMHKKEKSVFKGSAGAHGERGFI